jgi:hypothetical protein
VDWRIAEAERFARAVVDKGEIIPVMGFPFGPGEADELLLGRRNFSFKTRTGDSTPASAGDNAPQLRAKLKLRRWHYAKLQFPYQGIKW